jgi:hypothetical protein
VYVVCLLAVAGAVVWRLQRPIAPASLSGPVGSLDNRFAPRPATTGGSS